MNNIYIYHNPRWSKSRESVQILKTIGKEFEIIDYLKDPPSPEDLKNIAIKMGLLARDLIRSKESIFQKLNLEQHINDCDTLFRFMSENPKLIERPIIVKGKKAILGRPPENIYQLL